MAEVEAFYDGSGLCSDPRTPCITLAGYAATPEWWAIFSERWKTVLAGDGSRPSCDYLHMAELKGLRGEFSRAKDWDRTLTTALLNDILGKCLRPIGWAEQENPFVGAVCTINRSDYQRAKKDLPHLAAPENICVNRVIRIALRLLP